MLRFIGQPKCNLFVLGIMALGQIQSQTALGQTPVKAEIKIPGKDQSAYLEIFKPAIKQLHQQL